LYASFSARIRGLSWDIFLGALLPIRGKQKVKQVIKGCDYKEDV